MQLVAIRLDEYCFVLMAAGFLLYSAAPSSRLKSGGEALLGAADAAMYAAKNDGKNAFRMYERRHGT